jgi:hypothetical protein
MYNSIVVTNKRSCRNKGVYYKFMLVLDKNNWQTTASLKLLDQEYIAIFPGDLFTRTQMRLASLMQLPFDPEGTTYDGPEIKIVLQDNHMSTVWSNMTNLKCEWESPLKNSDIYINTTHQAIYEEALSFLTKLSDMIFEEQVGKN